MAVQRFRKRPVVIEAIRWTGDNAEEIKAFVGVRDNGESRFLLPGEISGAWEHPHVYEDLHETWVTVFPGHWVVKGTQGDFYLRADDVFAETYESVDEPQVTKADWDAFRKESRAYLQKVEAHLARLNEGPAERVRRLRDEEVARSAHPDRDRYVFLVITWGDGTDDEREAFGPYIAQPDGSHLEQITDKAKAWAAEHPDRPGVALHLFASGAVPPNEAPHMKATS
jgi:hypothetical protein